MSLALLVTGANGQLGSELCRQARRAFDVAFARGVGRAELDVADPFAVRDTVEEWARVVRSDSASHRLVVVNAAAYTAVDKAESDEETAYAVNAAAPAVLASACASVGAAMVQLSTDYVFPGDSSAPYEISAATGPRSAYGRTKLAGEQAVLSLLPAAWVVRTSWLYGGDGANFVKAMASLEKSQETVSVVSDQVGSPTWAADLARGLLALCSSSAPFGVYHATNRGSASWFEFAQAIFSELGADPLRVLPVGSLEFARPAPRPSYSVLSSSSWDSVLPRFQGWREALGEAFVVEGSWLRG